MKTELVHSAKGRCWQFFRNSVAGDAGKSSRGKQKKKSALQGVIRSLHRYSELVMGRYVVVGRDVVVGRCERAEILRDEIAAGLSQTAAAEA